VPGQMYHAELFALAAEVLQRRGDEDGARFAERLAIEAHPQHTLYRWPYAW